MGIKIRISTLTTCRRCKWNAMAYNHLLQSVRIQSYLHFLSWSEVVAIILVLIGASFSFPEFVLNSKMVFPSTSSLDWSLSSMPQPDRNLNSCNIWQKIKTWWKYERTENTDHRFLLFPLHTILTCEMAENQGGILAPICESKKIFHT